MKVKNAVPWLAVLAAALFYVASAPRYLQGGDTSEMVAAARGLLVVHPPGFPLWIRLLSFWRLIFPFDTEFWRASILTALMATGILAVLNLSWKDKPWLALAMTMPLAISPVFCNIAFLPDVFALHGLFVASLVAIYLFAETDSVWRHRVFPLVFGLAFAHHPTIVLLLPLLICEFSMSSKPRQFALAFAVGTILSAGLYLSLLGFNTGSPYSWGELKSVADVVHHALRTDYGSFQLKATGASAGFMPLIHFLFTSVLPFLAFLTVTAVAFWKQKEKPSPRLWTLAASLALTLGFFLLTNVMPRGLGVDVLLRFHLLPLLLLMFMCIWVWRLPGHKKSVQVLAGATLLVPLFGFSLQVSPALKMRQDSVTEDFARNLIRIAEKQKPTLILADDDAGFFSLRYLLAAESHPEIAVGEKSLYFHSWFYNKTRQVLPDFTLLNAELIHLSKHMNLTTDLLEPNLPLMRVLVLSGFQDGQQFKVEFQALGRILSMGQGQSFNEDSLSSIERHTTYVDPPNGPQGFSRGRLNSLYSHYFLTKALSASSPEESLEASRQALVAVPYASPALKNICSVAKDERCSRQDLGSEFY